MGRGSSKAGGGGGGTVRATGGKVAETSSVPALDKALIDRANSAGTVVDYGDSTARQYNNNVNEIQEMDLSNAEKKEAINKLHELTENQLKAEGNARTAYSMGEGVARPNARRMSRSADNRVEAAQKVRDHMNDLRKAQENKKKAAANKRLTDGLQNAIKTGSLEVTIDGVIYRRSSKRSKTFTAVR